MNVNFDQRALDQLLESSEGDTGRYLLRAAIQVERTAKRLCPVDTGRLRSSITHNIGRDGRGLLAKVGTNVSYARYVELGTRRMRARPYLRPALRSVR